MENTYKYLRIQGRELIANTLTGRGIFSMCMEMVRNEIMDREDADLFMEINDWFSENLPWPEPCKRQEPAICFFKTENADEMMKWIKPALWLLDKYNHPYYLVYTNTPGKIIYEDKYQIVASTEDITIEPVPKSWSEDK